MTANGGNTVATWTADTATKSAGVTMPVYDDIESQTETSAVLVTRGRKRMFGLRGGEEQRTEITLNDEGTVVSSRL